MRDLPRHVSHAREAHFGASRTSLTDLQAWNQTPRRIFHFPVKLQPHRACQSGYRAAFCVAALGPAEDDKSASAKHAPWFTSSIYSPGYPASGCCRRACACDADSQLVHIRTLKRSVGQPPREVVAELSTQCHPLGYGVWTRCRVAGPGLDAHLPRSNSVVLRTE